MTTAPPITVWSLEIETAVISTLWRQPQRLPEFLRVIDPQVHLTQPHLRHILEAINLAAGELGAIDWATVVQVVRELGKLEECGGLDGLNSVYTATEITPVTDPIFNHHVAMLKTYAEHRAFNPPRPVYRFTGGNGTAWRVKGPRKRLADYLGDCTIRGLHYQVRIEIVNEGEFLNLRFEPAVNRK